MSGDTDVYENPLLIFPCGHAMCHECLYGFLESNINGGTVAGVAMSCPMRIAPYNCGHAFTVPDIQGFLALVAADNEELNGKFAKFAREKEVMKPYVLFWLTRPRTSPLTPPFPF